MSVNYSEFSPYKKTKQKWYLGYNLPKPMAKSSTDLQYTIPAKYHYQPWRLAKELYNNEGLYYIFALLNSNILVDPVYDFESGTVILIPTVARVQDYLKSKRKVD